MTTKKKPVAKFNTNALYPGLILIGIGVLLVVLGALLPDADLRVLGLGALGSGLAALGIGRYSPTL